MNTKNVKCVIKAFVCLLLCASCSPRDNQETIGSIAINVKELSGLKPILDSYRYVRLQTPDTCIIKSVNKIVPTDSLLFVMDESTTIYICNYNGEFLKKISHKGHGRGEYLKITDFDVYGNQLWILDSQLNKILRYGLDGKLKHEHRLPDSYHSISVQPNGKVFLCSQQSNEGLYNFVLYDTETEAVVNKLAKFNKNNSCVQRDFHDFIGQSADTLVVANRFDHTIYNLTPDSYSPRLTLSFNTDDALPANTEELDYFQLLEETRFKNVVKNPYLYYQNPKQTVIGYYLFDNYGDCYYLTSIANDGTQHTARLLAKADPDFPYISPILAQFGDELVSVFPAGNILRLENNLGLDLFTNMGVTPSDNPIIFFHHIRK